MVDLAAASPKRPGEIFRYTKQGQILGEMLCLPDELRVHRFLSEWLRNPASICLLDPPVARRLFVGKPRLTLQCDNYEHAWALRKVFQGVEGEIPKSHTTTPP